jgi:hypothetical protein
MSFNFCNLIVLQIGFKKISMTFFDQKTKKFLLFNPYFFIARKLIKPSELNNVYEQLLKVEAK